MPSLHAQPNSSICCLLVYNTIKIVCTVHIHVLHCICCPPQLATSWPQMQAPHKPLQISLTLVFNRHHKITLRLHLLSIVTHYNSDMDNVSIKTPLLRKISDRRCLITSYTKFKLFCMTTSSNPLSSVHHSILRVLQTIQATDLLLTGKLSNF